MFPVLSLGVLLLVSSLAIAEDDSPLVETALGKVRGKWLTSRSGRKFAAFQGVPFAKPPVGKLRLQAPEPAESWEGIRDATDLGPVCIQTGYVKGQFGKDIFGQEDCLYLAVYTHNVTGNAPVLVHIHGGAFTMGTSVWYLPDYLMDEDIVVVNINYRVGIFGFLSFETEDLAGNQGLKDQVMALKWVKQNIAAFGGNPQLVTLIGESAGGASVHFHTVSPLSKGLFHRVVSESGTAYSPWALQVPGVARSRAQKLMSMIGCPTSPKEAVPCAMAKDAEEVVSKFQSFAEWQLDPLNLFGPILEPAGPDSFVSSPISKWSPHPVPMFLGLTSAEGLMRTLMFVANGTDLKWLSDVFDQKAPLSLLYRESAPDPKEVTRKLREFYLPRKEISMQDWVNLTTLYSDAWFTISVLDGANKHSGDVYLYFFDHKLQAQLVPTLQKDKDLLFGANHCQEALLIWKFNGGFFDHNITLTEEEVNFSKKLIKLIADFAEDGTIKNAVDGLEWKTWTEKDPYYVHIDKEANFHLKKDLAKERYSIWKSVDYRSNFDKTPDVNLAGSPAS